MFPKKEFQLTVSVLWIPISEETDPVFRLYMRDAGDIPINLRTISVSGTSIPAIFELSDEVVNLTRLHLTLRLARPHSHVSPDHIFTYVMTRLGAHHFGDTCPLQPGYGLIVELSSWLISR